MAEDIVNAPALSPETIPCPVCREQIQPGARKCIHCGSYLDWRRHAAVGANTIPVIAALVAVIAAASSWFAPLIRVSNSQLHAAFGGVGSSMLNGEVTITFTNDGSRIGVFNAAMLRVGWKAGNRDLSFDVPLGNGQSVPVDPDPRHPVTVQLAIRLFARLNDSTTAADALALLTPKIANDYSTAPVADAVCLIRTDSTDAKGKAEIQTLPVACLPFAPWLVDSIRRPIK